MAYRVIRGHPRDRYETRRGPGVHGGGVHRGPPGPLVVRHLVHHLDAATRRTEDDLHDALASALSFPGYYGRNLNALNDVLGDVAEYAYGSDPDTTG